MPRRNFPHRALARRTRALEYWKKQLNKAIRSEKCKSSDEYVKSQIENLEAKIKGAV